MQHPEAHPQNQSQNNFYNSKLKVVFQLEIFGLFFNYVHTKNNEHPFFLLSHVLQNDPPIGRVLLLVDVIEQTAKVFSLLQQKNYALHRAREIRLDTSIVLCSHKSEHADKTTSRPNDNVVKISRFFCQILIRQFARLHA